VFAAFIHIKIKDLIKGADEECTGGLPVWTYVPRVVQCFLVIGLLGASGKDIMVQLPSTGSR
jgi:hypothetical protein